MDQHRVMQNCGVKVLEPYIKGFFTMRDAYTKAGLRELFDDLFFTLDPEKSNNVYGAGSNFNLSASQIMGHPSWNTSSDEHEVSVPQCVYQEIEVEDDQETVVGEHARYQTTVSLEVRADSEDGKESSSNDNDKDEVQIIEEILNKESSLAKTVKGKSFVSAATKAKPPSSPKEFSITENLLCGLEAFKQNFGEKLPTQSAEGQTLSARLVNPCRKWTRSTAPSHRLIPYQQSPQKIMYPSFTRDFRVLDPRLREKGLLKYINGRMHYCIPEILKHFGEEKHYIPILEKANISSPLTLDQREYVARRGIQCVKAAYDYGSPYMFGDRLTQLSLDLQDTFPTIAAARWKIICNSMAK